MSARFAGKTVLVTGAGRGIGRACAERFLGEGANAVLVDVVAGIEADAARHPSGRAAGVAGDVADPDTPTRAVDLARQRFGGIDILVNNAGIIRAGSILDIPAADFDAAMRVNVNGVFHTSQVVARHMVARAKGGSIVNMSSVGAVVAVADQLAYVASKGAVRQLTAAMAVALAPHGIRVNAVGPGAVATDLQRGSSVGDGRGLARVLARTPLGRLATPEEIAGVVAFLACDDAAYITGQTVYADGGRLALNHTMPDYDVVRREGNGT